MEIDNLVSNYVSGAYTGPEIINAVEAAYYYCSSVYGSLISLSSGTIGTDAVSVASGDENLGVAIALLSVAILLEGRRANQARTDPNITVRRVDQLFTEEMRNMLMTPDAANEAVPDEGVMWDNNPPTGSWEV